MAKSFKKNILDRYIKLYDQYGQKYGKIALLYEIGSFYEVYGVENEKEVLGNVSQICNDIGLTKSRANKKILNNNRTNPLQAGFPSHSLDNFIKKLLKFQYTIIVYSQYGDEKKKVRKLDKIVSPSTYIEDIGEDDSVNLVSLYIEEYGDKLEINMMILDLSTGKCVGYSIGDKKHETIKKISRILHTSYSPKEVIFIGYKDGIEKELEIENCMIHKDDKIDKVIFRQSYQNEFLKKIFPNCGSLSPIEYISMEKYPSLVVSFIQLLNFANEHDQSIVGKISRPQVKEISQYMHLTHRTISQLNLVKTDDPKNKSLFDIINKTSTPGGKRLLKQRLLSPIVSPKQLKERYDEIEVMDFNRYEPYLENIADLDRLHRKLFLKNSRRDVFIIETP